MCTLLSEQPPLLLTLSKPHLNPRLSCDPSFQPDNLTQIRSQRPGRRKKRVRFADTLGLPLVQSKEYKAAEELEISNKFTVSQSVPKFQLCFSRPVSLSSVQHTALVSHIALSSLSPHHSTLSGTLLIHNLCFEKTVFARSTTDWWLSHVDTPCTYVRALSPHLDEFKFEVVVEEFRVGVEVEICLCFRTVDEEEFWDNNYGRNYKVMVVEGATPHYVDVTGLNYTNRRSTSVSPYW